jgi:3,4-dihydroxy 2-butanone 4-phosphate synthase/GTP cyclohydrolase II
MLSPFREVLRAASEGRIVIMVDDNDRENEGDLVVPTVHVTPEALHFMMREARGLICVSISEERAERLRLPRQTSSNSSAYQTPFAVSVDARTVAERGVTADARAQTMRRLIAADARPDEFISPGHVFPLVASPRGVFGRRGQTEGSYDLARLCGLPPSGVICEILNPDGTMARGAELREFAERHQLLVTSVAEVASYRIEHEVLIREVARSHVGTSYGKFESYVLADDATGAEHLALVLNPDALGDNPLVRIHSECLTGDVFGSRRCDCGAQLERSLEMIGTAGAGIVLYLRQEGRGIGLGNKIKAYALQDQGHDTVDANVALGFPPDMRDFAIAAKMLKRFGINTIALLTNNPDKVSAVERYGVSVSARVPVIAPIDELAASYLNTKRQRLGHLL